jgi:hypothetical protein
MDNPQRICYRLSVDRVAAQTLLTILWVNQMIRTALEQ